MDPLTQSKALFILLTKSTERVYCFHFECIFVVCLSLCALHGGSDANDYKAFVSCHVSMLKYISGPLRPDE